ncbi:MAG: hypothetical protein ACTSQN_17140 [Candidatus Heimdallarchaeota archaeon]
MKKTKLLIVLASIVMIGAFTGSMIVQAAPAQKLDFFVQDFMTNEIKNDVVILNNIIQVRDHQFTHVITYGYIGDYPVIGYMNTTLKTSKNLVTNVVIANGYATFYITWNGYVGGFTGTKAMKADLNADIAAGEFILTGKFNMQGFGDFEGMKLHGIIEGYNIMNFMIGTVLIPN